MTNCIRASFEQILVSYANRFPTLLIFDQSKNKSSFYMGVQRIEHCFRLDREKLILKTKRNNYIM